MRAPRRPLLWLLPLIVLLAGGFLYVRSRRENTRYATVPVDRGDIVDVVGATGLLQAVVTVQVGSQVSGTIAELNADFNSRVKKNQVVARLEQSLFVARLNQAKANVASARATVDRSAAAIADAKQKYDRALELSKQSLVPPTDLETARATYDGAVAQHQSDLASVKQAEAALNQAQVDLDHTVITAPVDGVVLARNVDVGQTVAASFQAPVLFVIANDLSQMEVNASIDEADIGRVRVGQDVTFTVDAFPDQDFKGRVEQIRLQPVTTNNVVTYNTIISVDNSSLKLMPGMTATVSVAVRQANNALRIPTAALRFRPEGYEAQAGTPTAAGATGGGAQQAGGQGGPGAAGAARARSQGQGGGFGGGTGRPGGQGRPGQGSTTASGPRPGLVFVVGPDGQPQPVRLKLGISDGRFVEVTDGLQEGARVITGTEEPGARPLTAASPATTNPFQPGRFQPRTR
ncbi:MAG TPA: efflux RND transporter periplasmic adaptor subunit [Vicinamibacteria bacterium]|nr:efflux RND transporter periplasmic adaptor subunit [Vicinamibacteria bacterium]